MIDGYWSLSVFFCLFASFVLCTHCMFGKFSRQSTQFINNSNRSESIYRRKRCLISCFVAQMQDNTWYWRFFFILFTMWANKAIWFISFSIRYDAIAAAKHTNQNRANVLNQRKPYFVYKPLPHNRVFKNRLSHLKCWRAASTSNYECLSV